MISKWLYPLQLYVLLRIGLVLSVNSSHFLTVGFHHMQTQRDSIKTGPYGYRWSHPGPFAEDICCYQDYFVGITLRQYQWGIPLHVLFVCGGGCLTFCPQRMESGLIGFCSCSCGGHCPIPDFPLGMPPRLARDVTDWMCLLSLFLFFMYQNFTCLTVILALPMRLTVFLTAPSESTVFSSIPCFVLLNKLCLLAIPVFGSRFICIVITFSDF